MQREWCKQSEEYKLIAKVYKHMYTKRNKVPYINHINEGLDILEAIGGSYNAQLAYCLHPIFQSDDLFLRMVRDPRTPQGITKLSQMAVALAVEYRHIANDSLSNDILVLQDANSIRLSPIKDVNDMLIADKVQNRKDFELYNLDHPRANELKVYFRNWLEKLGISEERYQELKGMINGNG